MHVAACIPMTDARRWLDRLKRRAGRCPVRDFSEDKLCECTH